MIFKFLPYFAKHRYQSSHVNCNPGELGLYFFLSSARLSEEENSIAARDVSNSSRQPC